MKSQCIEAVQRAAQATLGRTLSLAQLADIDARMQSTMRRLARTDRDWQSKSTDQRYLEAAQRAMEDVHAEADRKVLNAQRQAIKTAATESRVKEQMRLFPSESRSEALARDMSNVENGIGAAKAQAMSRLIDTMDAVKDGTGAGPGRRVAMFLFDAENPQMTRDLAHEMFARADGSSGNKTAQLGAKAWLETVDNLRQRFNAAGGDIGKLGYGWIPIAHDFRRVRGANDQASASAWVAKVMGLVDRSRYVDEAGRQLSDPELAQVLGEAWKSIATDGLSDHVQGQFKGESARANANSEHRVIHFKDGASYLTYMSAYGQGSMYDLMMGHVGKITRDIGLVENYGPNPNAQMRLQFDLARAHDGGELKRLGFGIGLFRVNPEGMWRTMNGEASVPGSEMGAAVFQHIRNVQALKLAGTFLKMFPDLATYFVSTGFNKLGYWNALAALGRSTRKVNRDWAAMHGLMADSAAREINRMMGENIGRSWSARLANSQMKLTLGEAWTSWLERAYGLTKMGALGRLAESETWTSMGQFDRTMLERAGVTASDWDVVRMAKLERLNDTPMLSPDSIVATGHADALGVADKLLGVIRNETADAVIRPDLMNRAAATWNGTKAGTGLGEIARSVMQFKSFPMAMVTRHWRQIRNAPAVTDGSAPVLANRLVYAGTLGVSATILGAISVQATAIARGKDPIDMEGKHAGKFWTQAFATGGAGGFYSDLLTRDSSQDRSAQDAIGQTLGPTSSDLARLIQLTKGNVDDRLAGKPTHAGAQSAQFVRDHLPYVNVWYARAAVDHAFMHSLQESLSPGYLGRMKEQAAKDWGEGYWWAPGSNGPDRAPDMSAAVGSR